MACDCPKVERTPLWSSIPESKAPGTIIANGESVECFAAAASQPTPKDEIGPQLAGRISNTFMASDLEGNVDITFTMTDGVPRTDWSFYVTGPGTPGPLYSMSIFEAATPSEFTMGIISGQVKESAANQLYHVTASNGLDSRKFTFFPKRGVPKDSRVKLLSPLPADQSRVSCKFGPRTPPVSGASAMHNGWDLAYSGSNPRNGPIFAAGDGRVVRAGNATGFGCWIIIEHMDGKSNVVCTTVYGHMYPQHLFVKVGDIVKAGQEISRVGNNGVGSGPHLHFEVHKGKWKKPTDPEPYINGTVTIASDGNNETADTNPYYTTPDSADRGMTTGESRADDGCAL